jgi:GxxExxY protein
LIGDTEELGQWSTLGQNILSEVTNRIIGAAVEVHRTLGPGFREIKYQRALAKELVSQGLDFSREVPIDLLRKGEKVGKYRVDLMIEDCLVESKAKAALDEIDFMQTLSYLKASGCHVGLLLNSGAKKWEIKRLLN